MADKSDAESRGKPMLGTIHYEVVTSPRGRVLRRYREAGADVR